MTRPELNYPPRLFGDINERVAAKVDGEATVSEFEPHSLASLDRVLEQLQNVIIVVRDGTADIRAAKEELARQIASDAAPGLFERKRAVTYLKAEAEKSSGKVRLALAKAAYAIERQEHHQ